MSHFRDRLRRGEVLAGTWIKTPHPHVVEVLALSDLDLLVLDAEHAPFDRAALDLCLLAARAAGKPMLVRPADADPAQILNALDCSAAGVILPHIRSAAEASAAVAACHYQPGGRGYAGSSRAAGYTSIGMAAHRANAAGVAVVAQIEDAEALDVIDEIAAVPGIDCLFIGRADLTVSLGAERPDDPRVVSAVSRIVDAGKAAGVATGMFLPHSADVPQWKAAGASLFLLQSDHDFLLKGAAALAAVIRA